MKSRDASASNKAKYPFLFIQVHFCSCNGSWRSETCEEYREKEEQLKNEKFIKMCGSDCLKPAPHPLLLSREIRSNTRKDKIVDREGFLDPHLFSFLIWIFFLHSPLLKNFLFSSAKHISSLLSPKFISSLTKYIPLHQIYSYFYHIFIWNYSFTTFYYAARATI